MNSNNICILALSWRDIGFPTMGGAEVFTHEMLKRAARHGMKIIHFAPSCDKIPKEEIIDGITYKRDGNIFNVIYKAKRYYKKNANQIDYVIDQCNTFRFFSKYWVPKDKRIFLIFQLTREIWDINMKFPFSKIGKILETPLLRMNRNDVTITESESTKKDLVNVGFDPSKIHIIPIGLNKNYLDFEVDWDKEKGSNFIYVGRYSKYKGLDVTLEAFGAIHGDFPESKMWIVGKKDNAYIDNRLLPICDKYGLKIGDDESKDVVTWGFVSDQKKLELQNRARALIFPSVREGWGMIISEAAVVGTPSITYNAPGMIDAVNYGEAGYVCETNDKVGLIGCMKTVLTDEVQYQKKRREAYMFSEKFDFEKTGLEFITLIGELENRKQM